MNTELSVIHDKILFAVDEMEKRVGSIVLPASVTTNRNIVCGLVQKVGRGYPLMEYNEAWKESKFWPLSVRPGDYIYVHDEDCTKFIHNGRTLAVTCERMILVIETPKGV